MKRVLSLCLALMMALSLCACGGGGPWEVKQRTDEFGDASEFSPVMVGATLEGTYSNLEVADEKLTVNVNFQVNAKTGHYFAEFELLEGGTVNASYDIADFPYTLKTKVGDTIEEYYLYGDPPNLNLYLSLIEEYNYSANMLFKELYEGNDIRCILNVGDSQYNFTIPSGNFAKLCDSEGFAVQATEMNLRDALNVIFMDDGKRMLEAMACVSTAADSMEPLEDDAIAEVMDGYYLHISSTTAADIENDAAFPWRYVYHYTQEGVRTAATDLYDRTFVDPDTGDLIVTRDYKETPDARVLKTEIKENLFYIESTQGNPPNAYQVKQITENLYLLCAQHEGGGSTLSSLLVRCDGNSMLDIDNALSNAIKNELPKLSF